MRAEGAAGLAPQIAGLTRKLFARLDGNQDNRVSLQEVKHSGILRKLGQARSDAEEKAVFDKADTNRDGVLSRGESFAFFNGLMQGSPEALALITMLVANDPDPATTGQTILKPPKDPENEHDSAENAEAPQTVGVDLAARKAAPAYGEALARAAEAVRSDPQAGNPGVDVST
jgi:hypothetical protein